MGFVFYFYYHHSHDEIILTLFYVNDNFFKENLTVNQKSRQ